MAYLMFLILWVLIFALFYQALGVGKGQENSIFDYLTNSWIMSTKGSDDKLSVNYWVIEEDINLNPDENNTLAIYSSIMTYFVNTVKYIN